MRNFRFYNSEQKELFLSCYKENKTIYEKTPSVFQKVADIEQVREKDFCDFDIEFTKYAIVMRLARMQSTRKRELTRLKDYVDWCVANGRCEHSSGNFISIIRQERLDYSERYRQDMVGSFEQLRSVTEAVYGSSFREDITIMYRLILYLMFYGFNVAEINQLHYANMATGLIKGRFVDPHVMELIDYAGKLKTVYAVNRWGVEIPYNLEENGRIIRRIYKVDLSESISRGFCFKAVDNVNKEYYRLFGMTLKLSQNDLILSGVFSELYEMQTKGVEVTPYLIFEKVIRKFKYKKVEKEPTLVELTVAKDYLEDYCQWKQVFYEERL